jgi:hypothetical protein
MKRAAISLVLLCTALLLLACSVQGPGHEPVSAKQVTPAAQVTLEEGKRIDIAMGFVNQSNQPVPQRDDFAGQWVLVNGEGEVRARGHVLTAGPLAPEETSFPLVWSGVLESGRYTLMWGSPTIGTVTTEFTVFDGGAGVGVVREEWSEQYHVDQGEEAQKNP